MVLRRLARNGVKNLIIQLEFRTRFASLCTPCRIVWTAPREPAARAKVSRLLTYKKHGFLICSVLRNITHEPENNEQIHDFITYDCLSRTTFENSHGHWSFEKT